MTVVTSSWFRFGMPFWSAVNGRASGRAVAAVLMKRGVRLGGTSAFHAADGPGFTAAFAGAIHHQAVPVLVNPLLAACDIAAAASRAGTRLLLASAQQRETLTALGTAPPVLIDGVPGPLGGRVAIVPSNR